MSVCTGLVKHYYSDLQNTGKSTKIENTSLLSIANNTTSRMILQQTF